MSAISLAPFKSPDCGKKVGKDSLSFTVRDKLWLDEVGGTLSLLAKIASYVEM